MDKSGINSLQGFEFQIKVFIYYMLQMKENDVIYYEKLDDISIAKECILDDFEDDFNNIVNFDNEIKAVQVKKTKVNNASFEKILLNWLILFIKYNSINEYILFTNNKVDLNYLINSVNKENLFLKVDLNISKKGSIYNTIKDMRLSQDEFINKLELILGCIQIINEDDINYQIETLCAVHFRKGAVTDITYSTRIKNLIMEIRNLILDSVSKGSFYELTFKDLMGIIEYITKNCTDEYIEISYHDFCKNCNKNLNDYADLREYKQLVACNNKEDFIHRHLQQSFYYGEYLRQSLEHSNSTVKRIHNLEIRAFEIFQDVREWLQISNDDNPMKRLFNCKKETNSYAINDHIKNGVLIYLTRFEEKNHQISWKDESNE